MDNLNLGMEKAIDEVIADACEMMLQDGLAVTELATKNKSLWENIKAFINTMIEKLKNAFKGVSESSAAAVELKNILGEWTELQKMWNEALVESEQYFPDRIEKIQFSKDNDYDNAVNPELLNYINDVMNGIYKKPLELIEVNEKAAEKIKKLFGKDSKGYIYCVNQNTIRHIIERHGKFGKTDTSMSNNDDIARLEYVLENFDEIYILTKNDKRVYSSAYKNSDNSPAPEALFVKRIRDEFYYVTVALSSSHRRRYGIVSVYKNKKEPSQVLAGNNTHSPTPEAQLTIGSSNLNISKSEENVKGENADFSQELNSLSPRFILASTLMNATTSVEEQEHLTKYKEAITSIEDKEERLKITRNAIRNAIFEREAGLVVSMESVDKMKKAAKNLERSIDYWDKKLLELEATTPLKNLMERQRKSLSERYMNEARTKLDETRAKFYASNRREQIKKNANSLISWLTRPDNTHYFLYV